MYAEPLEPRRLMAVAADPTLPVLSSNPGAPITLFLDFHGEPAQQWGGRTVPAVPAYDVSKVAAAFEVVADAYLPFNVNVTTVDPGGWDPGGQLAHNHQFRVVIGGNGAWTGVVEGGTADVGSYAASWEPNTAFVFSDYFPAPADVGDETIHESGHGWGLQHQSQWTNGVKTAEYADGFYMGNPFGGTLVGWGSGINSLGVPQNDVAVLMSVLGNNPSYLPGDRIVLPGTTPSSVPPPSVQIDEISEKSCRFGKNSRNSTWNHAFSLNPTIHLIDYGPRCRAAW